MSFIKESFPSELLPGVIQDYLKLCTNATEAPDEFLAAGALAVAAALAGPHYKVSGMPLNNFFLVVGGTGLSRKTTALSLAVDLFYLCLKLRPDLTHVRTLKDGQYRNHNAYEFVSTFSVEGIMEQALSHGGSTFARMNEYGSIFQLQKRQAQGNTITELTDMYDGRPISKKTVAKNIYIEKYALTLLASSTKEWVRDFGSTFNTSGGFVNRHLVFMGETNRINPFPVDIGESDLTDIVQTFLKIIPEEMSVQMVGERVEWVAGAPREIPLSVKSKELWARYYYDEYRKLKAITSTRTVEIAARELSHAIKLAALRVLMDQRIEIGVQDLIFGARLARWSTRNSLELLNTEARFDFGDLTNIAKWIINYLRIEEPQDKTEIAQRFGGKQLNVNTALKVLVDGKWLEEVGRGFKLGPKLQAQDFEVQEFFGKSSICEHLEKMDLEATTKIHGDPSLFDNSSESKPIG